MLLLPKEDPAKKERGWGIRSRKSFSALWTIGVIDISVRYALLTFLPFLLLKKGLSVSHVGFGLTLFFAGGAFGKFACGVLAGTCQIPRQNRNFSMNLGIID